MCEDFVTIFSSIIFLKRDEQSPGLWDLVLNYTRVCSLCFFFFSLLLSLCNPLFFFRFSLALFICPLYFSSFVFPVSSLLVHKKTLVIFLTLLSLCWFLSLPVCLSPSVLSKSTQHVIERREEIMGKCVSWY